MEENFQTILDCIEKLIVHTLNNENKLEKILEILRTDHENSNDLLDVLLRNRLRQNAVFSNNYERLENDQATEDQGNDEGSHQCKQEALEKEDSDNENVEEPTPQKSTRKRKINEHKQEINIFCSDCKEYFVRGDGTYSKHLKESKCRPHECTVLGCDKRFRKKSYLSVHIAMHSRNNNDGEPPQKVARHNNPGTSKNADEELQSENNSSINISDSHTD